MSSLPSTSSPEHDRDEADHTYAESEPEPSAHDTTPSKRLQKEGISVAAKRRVDAVTANMENRCPVTNCLPAHAVDYAHVLPRAAKDGLVSSHRFSKFIIGSNGRTTAHQVEIFMGHASWDPEGRYSLQCLSP
jgi:hypothetical protein